MIAFWIKNDVKCMGNIRFFFVFCLFVFFFTDNTRGHSTSCSCSLILRKS